MIDWQRGFRGLHRCLQQLQAIIADIFTTYVRRTTGNVVDRARVAAAMVLYARLCLLAGTPHDLDEAVRFLDEAATIYTEIGRLEKAKQALAMKPTGEADKQPRLEARAVQLAVKIPEADGRERIMPPPGDPQI